MKSHNIFVIYLLITVLDSTAVAVPRQYAVKPCDDICACVTPMVNELHGEGGINFEIDGNRFHLQKLLHELNPGQCHYNVTVPKDAVYLECLDRSTRCTDSRLLADFSLEYVAQPRDTDIRDLMDCWIEHDITRCFYRNATKHDDWRAVTWPCVYEKPRKYCTEGFFHYKGLCIRNATMSNYHSAVRNCYDMEADVIGISRRDWAYVNQSEYTNERIWVKVPEAHSANGTCKSARNVNGTAVEEPTDCTEQLPVLCTKKAFKTLTCETTPVTPTTDDPTTLFDMTTAAKETTRISTQTSESKPTTTTTAAITTTRATSSKPTTVKAYHPAASPEEQLKKDLDQVQTEIDAYFEELNVTTPAIGDTNENEPLVNSLDSLIDRLASSVSKSQSPAKSLTVETPSLVIKVIPLDEKTSEELGGGVKNQTFTLELPEGLKQAGVTLAMSGADVGQDSFPVTIEDSETEEDNGGLDDDGEDEEKGPAKKIFIGSLVATISLRSQEGGDLGQQLDEPLRISFSTSKRPDYVSSSDVVVPSCRFWKPSESGDGGVWSDEGCHVGFSNSTHTQCECNHLTSFAVLMSVGPSEALTESDVIHYMTLIGCSLSIFCLGLMLLVFTAQRLFRSDRNIIHMNLALSLMVGQLVFLLAIERTEPEIVCKIIGMSLHFFFLGSFFWMLNEGIYLISKTRSQKSKFLKLPTYLLIGWICPLITVGVTAGVSYESYGTDKQCWLRVDNGGIWAFVGPAIVIVIANMIMLSNVIRVFLSLRANMKKKQVERTWLALRAMLLTLPLLGLTWLFGLLTAIESTVVVFEYLFVIFNSLQGVFIFVLYCVLNDEVRKTLQKKVYKLGFMSKTSAGRTSKTTA